MTRPEKDPDRRWPAGGLVVAAAAGIAVVLLLGAVVIHVFGVRVSTAPAGAATAAPAAPPLPGATQSAYPWVPGSAPLSGVPTRLRIPSIAVDTTVVPLTLDRTGALEAPDTVTVAGWYDGGTAPGDVGPAVIDGHVDSSDRPGVFKQLRTLKVDDRIEVYRGGAWLTFLVVGTDQYAKNKFPTQAVYGPTPDAELRLITCGGTFDPTIGHYDDNIVVYAVLSGQS